MQSNEISSSLSQLTESLSLGSVSGTDWHKFLDCLVSLTRSESGSLKFTDRSNDSHTLNKQYSRNQYCLSWEIIPDVCHVILYSENVQAKQWADKVFLNLSAQIREIVKLGMYWQERHEIQDMTNIFSQSVKVGLADLNAVGELKSQNEIMDALVESKVLTLSNGRIQLSEDPYWIANNQKKMVDSALNYQSSHRIISSGGIIYRCILVCQKNIMNGWKALNNQFSLLFYTNSEQYNSHYLQALFSISPSEAKVVACFSKGLSAEEVATETGYKVSTIYSYIKELYRNLGINKQSQLTAAIWPELPLFSAS